MNALFAAMAVLVSITAFAENPQPAPVIEKEQVHSRAILRGRGG